MAAVVVTARDLDALHCGESHRRSLVLEFPTADEISDLLANQTFLDRVVAKISPAAFAVPVSFFISSKTSKQGKELQILAKFVENFGISGRPSSSQWKVLAKLLKKNKNKPLISSPPPHFGSGRF